MDEQDKQRVRDVEHVRLLGMLYCVSAGITSFFGLFPLFYVLMGGMMTMVPANEMGPQAAAFQSMGAMFATIGLFAFLFAQALAALKAIAGYSLLKRRNRLFCLVVGGISCLGIPYSTILGVFTFVVLLRDSVRELFVPQAAPTTAPTTNGRSS